MVQATVFQRPNIGLEATKGTPTAATHRLRSLGFEFNMNPEVNEFRAMGYVIPTVTALNREWSTVNVTGQPTYDELVFALASIIGKVTPTQPDADNAPSVYRWEFELATAAAQDPATYTVEEVNEFSLRYAYMLLAAFNINIARNGLTLGGSGIAQAVETGITPTDEATVEELPLVPVLPTHVNLYVDDAAADIGTTQFVDAFVANLALSNRYGMKWVLDRAQASFSEHVPLPLTAGVEFQVEKNASGMALISKLRNSETAYTRVEAIGPEIEGGLNYELVIDAATRITGGSFGDTDGAATVTWPTTIVDDADLGTDGTGLRITIQNTLPSLAGTP